MREEPSARGGAIKDEARGGCAVPLLCEDQCQGLICAPGSKAHMRPHPPQPGKQISLIYKSACLTHFVTVLQTEQGKKTFWSDYNVFYIFSKSPRVNCFENRISFKITQWPLPHTLSNLADHPSRAPRTPSAY